MSASGRFASSLRCLLGLVSVALVAGACVALGGAASGVPSSSRLPPATATPASSAASGLYLRAWQTQALPPLNTFGWLPAVTISDGQYIDGRVAVPMIYPGPLYVGLSARSISANGIAAIVGEARTDGLLGSQTDFSAGSMPGSITAHLEITADGATYDLTGSLPTDASTTFSTPGTPAAFTAFWNRIGMLDQWLAADLGDSAPYTPSSLAVLVTPPSDSASGAITPATAQWPLAAPFATTGTAFGNVADRCTVVSGADLAKLLPVVQASNVLTRFTDSTGATMSIQVRALVPGEESPCGS